MERVQSSLFEAAAKGCTISLQQLLIYDPLILERDLANCFNETPLHVAATAGHVDFVKKIIEINPQLVYELNLQKRCPLHLAAVKGHVDVAKALLSVARLTCLARDSKGLTPLHLAAVKGRDEAVKLLLEAQPDAARILVYEGKESILHLCVKSHQLEALKLVLTAIKNDDPEFINSKDANGNTALDLAVAENQLQTINVLVSMGATVTSEEVNAQNQDGLPATAVLIPDSVTTTTTNSNNNNNVKGIASAVDAIRTQLKETARSTDEALMVVTTLVVSMIFQVGANPPGGVWQDDNFLMDSQGRLVDPSGRLVSAPVNSQNNPVPVPHLAGHSVLARNDPAAYKIFCMGNGSAMVASLAVISILVTGWHLESKTLRILMYLLGGFAYTFVALSYSAAVVAITPPGNQDIIKFIRYLPDISGLIMLYIGLWQFVKFIIKWLRARRRPLEVVQHASETETETETETGRILRTQPSSAVLTLG